MKPRRWICLLIRKDYLATGDRPAETEWLVPDVVCLLGSYHLSTATPKSEQMYTYSWLYCDPLLLCCLPPSSGRGPFTHRHGLYLDSEPP